MNTNAKTDGVIAPETSVPHSNGDVIARLLALLLLLIISARVEAQFAFTNIAGGIMITRYSGPSQVVTIPDMINGQPVIAIGGSAFSPLTTTAITIPASVTAIAGSAFTGSRYLSAITVDGANPSYSSKDGVLFNKDQSLIIQYPIGKGDTAYAIPGSVTRVGEGAFSSSLWLKDVTVPNSVTNIGGSAFLSCSSLVAVNIPDSVVTIGNSAFSRSGIKSVKIGSGVISLGDFAFQICGGLTNVDISSNVVFMGNLVFNYCSKLTTINVDEMNASFGSLDGVLFNKSLTTLIQFPTGKSGAGYAIPGSVMDIAESAFSRCKLKSVTIPQGLTSIPNEVFSNCSALSAVVIPDSVVRIGTRAFQSCKELVGLGLGSGSSLTNIGALAFSNCSKLTNIVIPDSVISIEKSAFEFCGGMKSLGLGEGLLSIGDFGFVGCASLSSVNIPASLKSIGGSAFRECLSLAAIAADELSDSFSSLDGVLFDKSKSVLVQYPVGSTRTGYAIPGSVTAIGEWAFVGGTFLTNVAIPEGMKLLGRSAFYGCTGLTTITIPGSVETVDDWAFSQCSGLRRAVVGDGVIKVGTGAFFFCSSLSDLTFGRNVTSIGGSAFSGCMGLSRLNIPESVTTLGDAAFYNCSAATNLSLPSKITNIPSSCFALCESLTDVTIPEAVTAIGLAAFASCSNLERIFIPSGVTNIGRAAFQFCGKLKSVTIPEGVVTLGDDAFKSCTSLKWVYFLGDSPAGENPRIFDGANIATVYYLPGTAGWTSTFSQRPTVLWDTQASTADGKFGITAGKFGFSITGTSGFVVVVEGCDDLTNPVWVPVGTNTLVDGGAFFSDAGWMDHPSRVYRLRGE